VRWGLFVQEDIGPIFRRRKGAVVVEQRFLGRGRLEGGFGGGGGRYVEKAPAAVFETSLGLWVLDTGIIGPGGWGLRGGLVGDVGVERGK
jgi:hypothetical protein